MQWSLERGLRIEVFDVSLGRVEVEDLSRIGDRGMRDDKYDEQGKEEENERSHFGAVKAGALCVVKYLSVVSK